MALVKCKECSAQISDEAERCPQCGAKVKKPMGRFKIMALGLIAISVIKCTYDQSSGNTTQAPAKTPEQIKADVEKERAFQADVIRVKALKSSLKNPESFELVDAIRMADGTLCVTYRGTNSFNAITTERAALVGAFGRGTWSKHCSGKTGQDMGHIKHAL